MAKEDHRGPKAPEMAPWSQEGEIASVPLPEPPDIAAPWRENLRTGARGAAPPRRPYDDRPFVEVHTEEVDEQLPTSLDELFDELVAGELPRGGSGDPELDPHVDSSSGWELWLDELRAKQREALEMPSSLQRLEPSSLEVLYRQTAEDRFGPWSGESETFAEIVGDSGETEIETDFAGAGRPRARGSRSSSMPPALAKASITHVPPPLESEDPDAPSRSEPSQEVEVGDDPDWSLGTSDAPVALTSGPVDGRTALWAESGEAHVARSRWRWATQGSMGLVGLVIVLALVNVTARADLATTHWGGVAAGTIRALAGQTAATPSLPTKNESAPASTKDDKSVSPCSDDARAGGSQAVCDAGSEPQAVLPAPSLLSSRLGSGTLPAAAGLVPPAQAQVPATVPATAPATEPGPAQPSASASPSPSPSQSATDIYAPDEAPAAAMATPAPASDPAPALPAFDAKQASGALDGAAASAGAACAPNEDGPKFVSVAVTFAPSGRVTSALLNGSSYAGTETGSCIARVMRAAHVAPFYGDPVTVLKTVTLH